MATRAPAGQCGQVSPAPDPTPPPDYRVCLTWPPQVLAHPGHRGAVTVVAVAPRAGRSILLEVILGALRPKPITVLLQVALILGRPTQLPSGLHLVQQIPENLATAQLEAASSWAGQVGMPEVRDIWGGLWAWLWVRGVLLTRNVVSGAWLCVGMAEGKGRRCELKGLLIGQD